MGKSCCYLHGCKSVSVEEIEEVELLIPVHEITAKKASGTPGGDPAKTTWEDWKGTEIESVGRNEFESLCSRGFEVQTPKNVDIFEILDDLKDREEVVWAEPSWFENLSIDDPISLKEFTAPSSNDPEIHLQWHWPTTRVDQAWNFTEGEGICVAVIDKGFDADHKDLGVVSNLSAYYDSGINPSLHRITERGPSLFPDHDHGTACAGLVGAKRNNQFGGCGAAPECQLMLVACPENEWGKQTTLAKAIAYAADPGREFSDLPSNSGADIISISFSIGKGSSCKMDPVLKEAIEFATTYGRGGKGCTIFWSTGNGTGYLMDNEVLNHQSVIGVGQSGNDDRQGNYSYGPGLDFLAPGRSVYTCISGDRYKKVSGTSFAAPCAAGIAALVLSLYPELRWEELRDLLRRSCAKIWRQDLICSSDVRANYYGYGRLDALEAINLALRKRMEMLIE